VNHYLPTNETMSLAASLAVVAVVFIVFLGLRAWVRKRRRGRPTNGHIEPWRKRWREDTRNRS